MDRNIFFASLRQRNSGVFGTSLSQGQVDGCESLLDAMTGFSAPHAAHVLGEVYHETGGGMLPIKETVMPWHKDKNPSDAEVIRRLDRAWAKKQLPLVKAPYWRDGRFGRGQIQITHMGSYRRAAALTGVDLIGSPEMALDLRISALIAAEGCRVGLFTGKKLADFDGVPTDRYGVPYDHYGARAIVNGDKGKNGAKVAGYAQAFESALISAGWTAPIAIDATWITPEEPPRYLGAEPRPRNGGWLAALIKAILAIFGARK